MQVITDEFKLLADIVSQLNSDTVSLSGNTIIASGNDCHGSYRYSDTNPLSCLYPNDTQYTFNKSDIALINKLMKSEKCDVYFHFSGESIDIKCSDNIITGVYNHDTNSRVSYVSNIVTNTISNPPLYREDLESNVEFQEAISLRASDGLKIVVLDNKFLLTIFYGLFKLRKADTITVDIYHVDELSFMCRFFVNKKKYNIIYNIRFRY